jgi:dinuclear metal center YbgI/SA1388 family protein
MKLKQLLDALRTIAPERLAEPWDKVGLQIGDEAWRVRRGMLCIDLTEPVLAEAVELGAQLIVAYHPPVFQPLERVVAEDWKGRIVLEAARRRIAVYSPHTALDAAAAGVNDWLCESILPGLLQAVGPAGDKGATARGGSVRAIRPSKPAKDRRPYKLVTFVPPEHLDRLRSELAATGAGQIGDYSECAFVVDGEGSFRGGESTNPTVGQRGRLERVAEKRIEMIVPPGRISEAVAALMKAHPYEEPAFDLIRLDLPPSTGGEGVGQGRVVTLDRPIPLPTLVRRVGEHLGGARLDVAMPRDLTHVARVGFCAGAGGSLLKDAGPIDAFVTGEMRHHDILDAHARGVAVILAGHTQTERPYLPVYRDRIRATTAGEIAWTISNADRPPSCLTDPSKRTARRRR